MIKDYVRHEYPTPVYLQAAVTFPVGQYDADTRIRLSGGISVKRKLKATDVGNATDDYGLENGAFLKANIFFGSFERNWM